MYRIRFITVISLAAIFAAPSSHAQVERVEKGNLLLEGIPEISETTRQRLKQYQDTRAASMASWLPDGSGILISTRFAETNQIHRVDHPGGARSQITFFDEPVGGASVSPDPGINGFLFSKDVGGSEFYQIFFQDLQTGAYRMLTDGEARNGGALWSNGGNRFVYYTTARNGTDWDLHVRDFATGTDEAVLTAGGVWFASDWSPDDTRLIVTRYVSANESHPHVLDLSSGSLTPLSEGDEKVSYGSLRFDADGDGILFSSDRGSEFHRLRHLDLESGEERIITSGINWNVDNLVTSRDGSRIVFTVNDDGYETMYLLDPETYAYNRIQGAPDGIYYGIQFSPDGSRLGFVVNGPTSPGDVYTLDFGSDTLERWTYSETGGLSHDVFDAPSLVRYETFDEVDGAARTIPAFYYRPEGEGPFPVLIDIHGGPEGQERPYFSSVTQFYVNELGLAVLAPNVRGSDGYGKSYLLLDNGLKREDSVRDIGALIDWIEDQPELDASRIGVIGGSYGGYMVLAAMTHYNDRLKAGVDIVGISNFVTFLENTQDYRRDLRRAEYGDERDPEMRAHLTRISPTTNARQITKPLLIGQGLNDPRVPATESEQMVSVIRENGGDVWYFLARDEGHGFSKRVNRDYWQATVVTFLEKNLIGGGPTSVQEVQ